MTTNARFTKINESFQCAACGRQVPPSQKSCRNHCPDCLVSRHVDINPGDRENECQGLMDAIDYELTGKKGLVLIFKCRSCNAITRNIAATEEPQSPDNYDKILALKSSVRL